jgi:hypothetical protein
MDPLSINNEMAQFDKKNRDFYNSLTEEQKKKFSNFLMIRYGSSVSGSADLQHFYLVATNERLNKKWFNCSKHPQLQWLMATTVSPGMGTHRHNWIAPKKKEAGATGIKKQLTELYPLMKDDEIELMSQINTKKDIDEYLKAAGEDIKKK